MKTALLCSGQGSQYVGMMKDLAELRPGIAQKLKRADEILGYGITKIAFEGPLEMLKETRYTQPALFLHSALIADELRGKTEFDGVAGHSVGEYAAIYAAGAISFEDALKLVSLRGELMFKAGENEPGTMFAVINLDDDKVEEVCKELTSRGEGVVVAANFNSPGQVVVSGSRDFLRANVGAFKEAGARMTKELVVSGAFHSPLMQPAKEELERAIAATQFTEAKVPVYANVTAAPLTQAEEIKNALIAQLTSPVRWTQSLRRMQADGFGKFIEIGAGSVLQGLVKRTLEGAEALGVDKASELPQ